MLPKLFACMMLKDEAHNIRRCLDSIKDLCDEIVIVDTGSTDDTVKIAREYGAIVYPGAFNWRKPPIFDFSLHRNSGLQYCEELGADWMFVIDGDEALQPLTCSANEFKSKLLNIRKEVDALGCQVHENKDGEFKISWWGTRFFRARKGVFYEGICHNRPKLIGTFAAGTDIVLYHYGYADRGTMDAKRVRTLTLLEKRIRDDPNDYGAHYYRTLTLFGMDRIDDGIESGIKALEIIGERIDDDYTRLNYFGVLYYAIGWAYFRKWKSTYNQEFATKAYQWWMTGWEYWPEDLDLNFCLCNIGYLGNRPDLVELHGKAYMKAMAKFDIEVHHGFEMPKFENNLYMDDFAMGPRHIHMATPYHKDIVTKMMDEMALHSYTAEAAA